VRLGGAAVLEDARRVHGSLGQHAQDGVALVLERRLAQRVQRLAPDEAPAVDTVAPLELGERLMGHPVHGAADEGALPHEVPFALEAALHGVDDQELGVTLAVLGQSSPVRPR
jgi:hypothetical protein